LLVAKTEGLSKKLYLTQKKFRLYYYYYYCCLYHYCCCLCQYQNHDQYHYCCWFCQYQYQYHDQKDF
jgi:hypothetical protein